MEQALFSPPLSKQRVEFAVRHINDCHSTTLVTTSFSCQIWDFSLPLHFFPSFRRLECNTRQQQIYHLSPARLIHGFGECLIVSPLFREFKLHIQ